MIRLGPVVILTEDELHNFAVTGPRKQVEQMEATIRRQHDLLVDVEAQRDLAVAQARERNETVGEQQDRIDELEDRLATILRHPVSGKPEDDS